MNNKPEKDSAPRLSVRILFTLLFVAGMIQLVMYVPFLILRELGFEFMRSNDKSDVGSNIILYLLHPALLVITLIFCMLALNKIVVSRVRRLKEATKEVAKGNFDVTIDVIGTDELSELTESFKQMSAELKANEYLSKEFVRNVSHEYKTPISAIRAYGELLEIEADNKEIKPAIRKTIKEYAQIITQECDRLNTLSKSAIQLSLLDSTTLIKKDDIFKPAEQIRDILRLMQVKWLAKNITLDLQLDESEITSNEQLLYQVWLNLVSNAIKYSNENGIIRILLSKEEGLVRFEIEDNGIGINDEDKDKIFTQFFMADKSRNSDGNGLGLSIVKKIVEKLGGEVGFESREGDGSTFKITIKDC